MNTICRRNPYQLADILKFQNEFVHAYVMHSNAKLSNQILQRNAIYLFCFDNVLLRKKSETFDVVGLLKMKNNI